MSHRFVCACLATLAVCAVSPAATLQVGPTRTYTTVLSAYAAATSGDTIEIDSGTYYQGAGWVYVNGKHNVTFRGVGPTRPILDAGNACYKSKGIFVIEIGTMGTVIENIELKNAKGAPAAGVRMQGNGLTMRNVYIHDCDNGVLNGGGNILFEYCEFYRNGDNTGQTHNIYLNGSGSFTMRYCWSHGAKVGHEVKTRMPTNYIQYNLLSDDNGSGSYEINIPDAGLSYVIGNCIYQGGYGNTGMISYAEESTSNSDRHLYVANNTLVSTVGGTFVRNASSVTSVLQNNIFQGGGTVFNGSMSYVTNLITTEAYLANVAGYDFRLTANSTGAINAGTTPTGLLIPSSQYGHPYARENRPVIDTIDIGAYEYTAGAVNTAPTAEAGNGQTITLPTSQVTLSGSGSDDGLPVSSPLMYTWTQVSGPANGNIASANAATTLVTGLTVAGSYVFRLTVSDSELQNDDTVTVIVNPRPNQLPTVSAGQDIVTFENRSVSLHATGSDPDQDSLTFAWTQTAGANALSLAGTGSADLSFASPVVSSLAESMLAFQVAVNDGYGGTASSTVNVRVFMCGDANLDGFVNVGDLQALITAWGSNDSGAWGNWNANADFFADGYINVGDLQLLVANWGRGF